MTGQPLPSERKPDFSALYQTAVRLHAGGDVLAAARDYRRILLDRPAHADVLDLYGTALFQLGSGAAGRPHVAASLKRRPLHGPAWNHLGAIDRSLRREAAARGAFLRATVIDPGRAEPLVNLAAIFGDRDEPENGLRLNRRAGMAVPHSADVALRQGILLSRARRSAEAVPFLEAAWRRRPSDAEVAVSLARAHIDLGHLARARRVVRAGIALAPEDPDLYGLLATTHDPRTVNERDILWAGAASVLRPLDAATWLNVSAETYRDGRISAAHRAARRAVLLNPASVMGLGNLMAVALSRGETAVCRTCARRALTLEPGNSEAENALAEVEFRTGDARTAWTLYEARVRRTVHRPRLNLPPIWQGPGTETGPLLIASEQGVGDEVTFLSCLAELFDRIAQPVIVEVDERLVALVARSFPAATVVPRQLVPGDGLGQFFDYRALAERYGLRHHILSGSLPRMLDRGRDRPLERVGYLKTDPARVDHWRRWLASLGRAAKVGMIWRTAQWTRLRARDHCTIEDVLPVFATPGCTFVNLMAGDTAGERARVDAATGMRLVTPPDLDIWRGLDDLAALMRALDVVVAARTANCAFAGAVGTPTIRLAAGFLRISNGREFFFPNVHPVFDRDESFDGPEAGRRAAAMLAKMTVPACER